MNENEIEYIGFKAYSLEYAMAFNNYICTKGLRGIRNLEECFLEYSEEDKQFVLYLGVSSLLYGTEIHLQEDYVYHANTTNDFDAIYKLHQKLFKKEIENERIKCRRSC